MRYTPSAADRMLLDHRAGAVEVGEPIALQDYIQVSPRIVPGESTGIVVIHGQSNCANFGNYTSTLTQSKCHMLNPYDGGVYEVKEPVVGCNGGLPGHSGNPYGSMTARIPDKLRAASWRQRVIMANCAAGGTSSDQWATGDCNQRIRVMARRLKALNYTPTIIVRHQGETDQTSGYTASRVRDNIRLEKATWVSEGITAPMMVCTVAYSSTASVGSAAYTAVRQGQADALSTSLGIYAGVDTDIYGAAFRQSDDLHWNTTGAEAVATDIKNRIIALVP